MSDEAGLQEELQTKSNIGKKRQRSRFAQNKEAKDKEHFMHMYHDLEQKKKEMEEMDEDELLQEQAKKAKLKALFREEDD